MNQSRPLIRGFTLIEIVVVVALLAAVFVITIVGLSPARQFQLGRNNQRQADVTAIGRALNQYDQDGAGIVSAAITTTPTNIGTGAGLINLTTYLVPNFLPEIPKDPTSGTDQDTKYAIYKDKNNCAVVYAPQSEVSELRYGGCTPTLALDFNNPTDRNNIVEVPNSALYDALPTTWMAWIKMSSSLPTVTNGYEIMGRHTWDSTVNRGFSVAVYRTANATLNGSVRLKIVGTGSSARLDINNSVTGPKVNDNQWHHVAVVVPQYLGTARIYVDGVERTNSTTWTGAINWTFNSQPFRTGGGAPGDPSSYWNSFTGSIYDVRVYNGELTNTDIGKIYNNQPIAGANQLLGWWKYNDGRDVLARDSSGNSNDGILRTLSQPLAQWVLPVPTR